MRHFTNFVLALALFLCAGALQAQIVAEQTFNGLSDAGSFTIDMLSSGGQLTNSGANNSGGDGLDFVSTWVDTRSEGMGPVTSGEGNDFIGVSSFSGSGAPNVSPTGVTVASGTEHNFQFNDTDGALNLTFEAFDFSGLSSRSISLKYWIADTGYESSDAFTVLISDGVNTYTALYLDDSQLEAMSPGDAGSAGEWNMLMIDIEYVIGELGFDASNLTLIIIADTNSGSENIFVDDIFYVGSEDGGPGGDGCSELFISEYAEGSSNNKCIEIYNPTGSTVDLNAGGYTLAFYFNGSMTPASPITLNGSIAPYDVFVICDNDINTSLFNGADEVSSASFYNGNDIVVLSNSSGPLDFIGQIGNGANFAQNVTLRRASFVAMGDPDGTDAFDPSAEWMTLAQDDFSGFGSHDSDCAPVIPCNIDDIVIHAISACDDAGTIYVDDDTYTASVTVSFTSPEEMGTLELDLNGSIYSVMASSLDGDSYTFDVTLPADGQPLVASAFFSENPICALTTSLGSNVAPCSIIPDCSELFISEYVEGSGFNKCIEIYNPTSFDINLASFGLFLSFNGGTFEPTIPLMGTIKSGDVYVICNTNASDEFRALADQLSGNLGFNGNDAVLLQDMNGTLDALGQLGNSSTYASNVTIRRASYVQAGDNNPFDPFNLSEWQSYASNTSFGLGYHRTDCVETLPFGYNLVAPNCPAGEASYDPGMDMFNLYSECYNASPVEDDLTYVFQPICGDGEIISKVNVSGGGFAGLMFRESVADNAGYVWLFTRGSNRAYFNTRSMTATTPQTSYTPQFNRQWLRLVRNGDQFTGYLSFDGNLWYPVFQKFVPLEECLFVGMAVHSIVDGYGVTGSFMNTQINGGFGGPTILNPETGATANGQLNDVQLEEAEEEQGELVVMPNPAIDQLQVALPKALNERVFVQIYDLNGKVVYGQRMDMDGNRITLPLEQMNLSGGMYMLRIDTDSQRFNTRFIKAGE